MPVPVIAELPTPPSRNRPETFADEADAFLGALPDFREDMLDVAAFTEAAAVVATSEAGISATKASEAAASAATALAAAGYRVSILFSTWAQLSAVAGTYLGQSAAVFSDAGTHTDPVVGGTVGNAGVYSWSIAPAGWRRVGALPADTPIDPDPTMEANSDAVVPSQKAVKTALAAKPTATLDTDSAMAANSDTAVPSQKAVKTALAAKPTATLDTDGTLGANSDTAVPSQKAVRTAINAAVAGLSWKQAVRAATTANGTLASAFANGQTIDGVVLATGDRILLKNQSTAADNGLYVVNASGAPTRTSDADAGAELVNASVYVSEGTTQADTQWVCTTNGPITVGSTAVAFAQFGVQAATEFTSKTIVPATTTSGSAQPTGLNFTPQPNKCYEFTATLLVGVTGGNSFAVGINWPTGSGSFARALIEHTANLSLDSSNPQTTSNAQIEVSNANNYLSGGMGVGSGIRMMTVRGILITGATISGSLALMVANTTGQTSTVYAGSILRVKEIA